MTRWMILFTSFLCLNGYGQKPDPKLDFRVNSKQDTVSTDDDIKAFEAPIVKSYTLAPGDEITIEVWGHPELSGHHVVGPDGRVTLPVVGVIKLEGMSREDAEKSALTILGHFYSDLAVTIRIDRYTSFRIYVLGRVTTPGAIQFESQPTILDVITRAGALPIGGIGADKAVLARCAVIRGRDKMVWVDLRNLLNHGDLSQNIRLARNDLLYIPDSGDQSVYVLGQVLRPGAFRLTAEMSFLDAFTEAGGLGPDAAIDKITLVRSSNGSHREFRLRDLLDNPRELNFSLNEGDIIYVPERPLGKLGYVLQKTSPLTGFAVIGSIVK